MKKIVQALSICAAMLLASFSAGLHAEDIDIYVDNSTNSGVPNVLFVMDTGANFSSSASTACTYWDGTSPTLGQTAGGIEQCALVNAIHSLPNGAVNIGILVNNSNGFATDTRSTSDAAYHETCTGTYGGCLVRKLTYMDSAAKTSMISFIKSWKTSGQDSATEFNVKSGGDRTANMMQEAWAYYNGKVGMSTKSYDGSILSSGCQRNFVIFVGNSFNNSGTPGDSGTQSPYDGTNALTSSQVGASTAEKAKISETVTLSPATCGVTSVTATTSASNWSENWADEWARLMYTHDGGASDASGLQNIITYTIGVVDDSACKPDYPALLSTMAKYGGGKYFKTSTSDEIANALAQILNEVQAVNSVFSSASLPVSVNAEGSYLNQIFLGMFRPDSSGSPRWMGNLKQYQLISSGGALVMGDNSSPTPKPAISSAGTGFLSPTATSFWTKKDVSAAPDAPDAAGNPGGFFKNDPKGTPATSYDAPDGEVVEKGGVAQQLRLANLTSTFTGASGATNNPRRLYTYCPSGSSTCSNLLTDSANDFSTANTNITSAMFGATTSIGISSISRSGATATVTTSSNHGLSSGISVTISGTTPADYNGTRSITVTGSKTFTITGLPTYPTTPSQGTYLLSATAPTVKINSITRSTSTTNGVTTETATATTATAHGLSTASSVVVSGASPAGYNYAGTPTAVPSSTTFTFPITIDPPPTNANSYQVAFVPVTPRSMTMSRSGTTVTVTLTGHGYFAGQSVVIADSASTCSGTFTVASVANNGKSFTYSLPSAPSTSTGCTSGTVTVDTTPVTISAAAITRPTTSPGTGTATIGTSRWFGLASGDTASVNITYASGSATNESGFLASAVTLTCKNSNCTQFSYPFSTFTATSATGTAIGVSVPSVTANVAAGALTRDASGNVTVSGLTGGVFSNGQSLTVSATGTARSDEAGYVGSYTVSCTSPCTTITYGPVPLTPQSGSGGVVFANVGVDKDALVKWVRGADNQGDEKGPGGTVTVRPSIHGDVLHSRPLVINYGDSRGIVVYYGANDGVYRAVNGNQTASISLSSSVSVPAGGELWGLILPEHYGSLSRLKSNSPELKFPSTFLASALPKDYFIDGPTGVYQKLKADNTIDKAILYLTMRRGGRFIYALDVSDPANPKYLWKISNATAGFSELGETWSRPRLTLLQNSSTPVLVFGGGYDPGQDDEPPKSADTMGRAVYIVDAVSGSLIWSANATCATSSTCRNVPNMQYAIPSEVAFVDRDGNGHTDKMYVGDLGGNIWRLDVSDASSANWTVTRLAALGCNTESGASVTGACPLGTTPRKFFYPPSVLTVKGAGVSGSYEAVSIASGDREHPLRSSVTGSSYLVKDRFFMIKDLGTTLGTPSTSNVTAGDADLFNATSSVYDGSKNGFYFSFATGEKAVNAPVAVNGSIFFSTNRPKDPTTMCSVNLGEAKAYAVSPFDGGVATNVLQGGGLPPSAVSGLVTMTTTNTDGSTSTTLEKFCIGCGLSGSQVGGTNTAPCNSALENCNIGKTIPKNLRRTYWYKK